MAACFLHATHWRAITGRNIGVVLALEDASAGALNETERFTVTLSETAKGWQASTEAAIKHERTTPRAKRATLTN